MARKKNLLKSIVNNDLVRQISSDVYRAAASQLPVPIQPIAQAVGRAVGGQVKKKKTKKSKTGISMGAVTAVSPKAIQYANAPTEFGVTVSSNTFVTKQIDKDTIRCMGKLNLPYNIAVLDGVVENDGALFKATDITPSTQWMFNPLNVASNDIDSRLGLTAQTYTRYTWRSLELEYIPSTGTDNGGQFALAICWDPTSQAPTDAKDLLNYDDSVETTAWKPTRLPIVCPASGLKEDWCFNQLEQTDDALAKQNYQCQLMGMITKPGITIPSELNIWGTLCLYYACDFFKPSLFEGEFSLLLRSERVVPKLSLDAFVMLKSLVDKEFEERIKDLLENKDVGWRKKSSPFGGLYSEKEFLTLGKELVADFRRTRGKLACFGARLLKESDVSNSPVKRNPMDLYLIQKTFQKVVDEGQDAKITDLQSQITVLRNVLSNLRTIPGGVVPFEFRSSVK